MRRSILILLPWLALAAGASAQAPTFSTTIVSVRVDALVTDERGHAVTGLTAPDFEVLDNGVPQTVDLIATGQLPVNVVLALDVSESTAGERLAGLRSAARALVAGLQARDQAALLTFNAVITRGTGLTSDVARVRRALDHIGGEGGTSLYDATYAALMVGRSDVGRTLVIVFSDGVDTSSWLSPAAVFLAARRSNAVVYSATIDAARQLTFLPELGRLTGGVSYPVEANGDLAGTFAKILDEFRHRYLLSFTPAGVPESGWHRLQVRVKTRRAIVKAREGYGG